MSSESFAVGRFVEQAAERLWSAAATPPLAVVQLGSLSHGGFSDRFSDIDLGLLFAEPQSDARVAALRATVEGLEPAALARRVSLFWSTPDFGWGRLRPIDQADLCDHGRALRGALPERLPRPDRAAVRRDMVEGSLPYYTDKTRRFSDRPATDADFKELVRCLLYPASFVYTWRTGNVTGNDTAVAHLEAEPLPGLDPAPIRDALAVRRAALGDAALDTHRAALVAQHRALIGWLAGLPDAPAMPPGARLDDRSDR